MSHSYDEMDGGLDFYASNLSGPNGRGTIHGCLDANVLRGSTPVMI